MALSYSVVTADKAILYIDSAKLTDEVRKHLGSEVEIRPYEAVFEDVQALSSSLNATTKVKDIKKWMVSNRASWALVNALGGYERVDITRSPIEDSKAVKNETELNGMRACHIRDGAAQIEFFAWLEEQLSNGVGLDEVDAGDKLEEFRRYVAHGLPCKPC